MDYYYNRMAIDDIYEKYVSYLQGNWKHLAKGKGDNLALCIGAGVTKRFVGEWSSLLSELALLRLPETAMYRELKEQVSISRPGIAEVGGFLDNIPLLELAEYLLDDTNKLIRSEVEWQRSEFFLAEQVQYVIKKCEARLVHSTVESYTKEMAEDEKLCKYFIENRSASDLSTLQEVLAICLLCKIKRMIVYNFDTVLERLLKNKEVCRMVAEQKEEQWPSIEVYDHVGDRIEGLSNVRKSNRTLRIDHVHGTVYREQNPDSENPYIHKGLIFSETSYRVYQEEILSISQAQIASIMQNSDLLCIGFSGKDENFRHIARMIYNAKHRRLYKKHRPRVWITLAFDKNLVQKIKRGDAKALAILAMLTESSTNYWKSIGVDVLWAEDHNSIAENLKAIYKV